MPSFHDQLRQILVEAKMTGVPIIDAHNWLNTPEPNADTGSRTLAALRHSILSFQRNPHHPLAGDKNSIKLTAHLGHYTHYTGWRRP